MLSDSGDSQGSNNRALRMIMFLFSIRIFQERVGLKVSPGLVPVLMAQYKLRGSAALGHSTSNSLKK